MVIRLEELEGKNAEIKSISEHSMVLEVDGVEIFVGGGLDWDGRGDPMALLDVSNNRILDEKTVEDKDFIKL